MYQNNVPENNIKKVINILKELLLHCFYLMDNIFLV